MRRLTLVVAVLLACALPSQAQTTLAIGDFNIVKAKRVAKLTAKMDADNAQVCFAAQLQRGCTKEQVQAVRACRATGLPPGCALAEAQAIDPTQVADTSRTIYSSLTVYYRQRLRDMLDRDADEMDAEAAALRPRSSERVSQAMGWEVVFPGMGGAPMGARRSRDARRQKERRAHA
jgi:hypothetical protein